MLKSLIFLLISVTSLFELLISFLKLLIIDSTKSNLLTDSLDLLGELSNLFGKCLIFILSPLVLVPRPLKLALKILNPAPRLLQFALKSLNKFFEPLDFLLLGRQIVLLVLEQFLWELMNVLDLKFISLQL